MIVRNSFPSNTILLLSRDAQTLWFMQASLRDLSLRHDSPSFVICQRTLHKCHELIFGDLPQASPFPYSTLTLPFQSRLLRMKVKANVGPALVGLGIVLASSPGMPKLAEVMGEVAIEQGRVDEGVKFKSLQLQEDEVAHGIITPSSEESLEDDDSSSGDASPNEDIPAEFASRSQPTLAEKGGHRAIKSELLVRRGTIDAARTTPALPLHLQGIHRSRLSCDPLGQSESRSISRPATPSQSTPSISSLNSPVRTSTLPHSELLLQKYDFAAQSHLLRGHYCRSEVCCALICKYSFLIIRL